MIEVVWLQVFFVVVVPLSIFIGAAVCGRLNEKAHLEDLARREESYKDFPIENWQKVPMGYQVTQGALVTGAVVISEDVWKRFLARLKALVGGNIKSYETLMDRARREACLRMLEDAKARGADAVMNVRYDSADIGSMSAQRSSPLGVEVLVFGTALNLRKAEV
jgi:uncharacterized protein YbjQ (UPF0145 family)